MGIPDIFKQQPLLVRLLKQCLLARYVGFFLTSQYKANDGKTKFDPMEMKVKLGSR